MTLQVMLFVQHLVLHRTELIEMNLVASQSVSNLDSNACCVGSCVDATVYVRAMHTPPSASWQREDHSNVEDAEMDGAR